MIFIPRLRTSALNVIGMIFIPRLRKAPPDDFYTNFKNYRSQCYWENSHHDNIGCNY